MRHLHAFINTLLMHAVAVPTKLRLAAEKQKAGATLEDAQSGGTHLAKCKHLHRHIVDQLECVIICRASSLTSIAF